VAINALAWLRVRAVNQRLDQECENYFRMLQAG
jgi:hypothetical protein